MCHLVTWRVIPKTDAEIARTESHEFRDNAGDKGIDLATRKAEELVKSGAKDVRVWKLVGEAQAVTTVEWKK